MHAVRLDRLPTSEEIYRNFVEAMRSAWAVLVDITLLNENVMYEIGYAHGRGLTPLIYTIDAARLDQLPLYVRALNVRLASEERLGALIEDYLHAVKGRQARSRFESFGSRDGRRGSTTVPSLSGGVSE